MSNRTGTGSNDTLNGTIAADTITAQNGADLVLANDGNDTVFGGEGNDFMVTGPETATTTPLALTWSTYADEANLAGPFTQGVGGIDVSVSYSGGIAVATFSAETSGNAAGGERGAPVHVAGGEPFNANSGAELYRPADCGCSTSSTVTFDFAAPSDGSFESEVTNVQFRVSDVDKASFTGSVTVRAYEVSGNGIPVVITETSASLTSASNSVTATGAAISPDNVVRSVLFQIAGPVATMVFYYTDLTNAQQAIRISDGHFEAIPTDADFVDGGLGAEALFGVFGDDTLLRQDGDDSLSGGMATICWMVEQTTTPCRARRATTYCWVVLGAT
jgi:Ca2+-binding RTX toxin-like protein